VTADFELRERIQAFSQLRAAQRALARCMHPAVLAPVREQGRQLLIQLKALDDHETTGALPSAEADLADVDRLLSHQIGQTLEVVASLDFVQVRSSGALLCSTYRDETSALIDLVLEGDLSANHSLRLIEFLVTMLATEESDGRRRAVHEPSELTPGLSRVAQERVSDLGQRFRAGLSTLENATESLNRGVDQHELRDELRACKKQLGVDILHPRVLATAVAYNVAMWNQVAAQIDSTLAIDEFADDLLAEFSGAPEVARRGQPQEDQTARGAFIGSTGFARLVAAVRTHIRGQVASDPDELARRIVDVFKFDDLVPREVEALETDDVDPINELICASIVLGRTIRHGAEVQEDLRELGVDPEALATQGLTALMEEMRGAAGKLFADSRYDEAFELSQVKTRNLATLAVADRASTSGSGEAIGKPASSGRRWRLPFNLDLSPGLAAKMVATILGVALVAVMLSRPGGDARSLSPGELAEVSPFLVSGRQGIQEGVRVFIGKLDPTWEYLGTKERRAVANEIGERLQEFELHTVVLRGVGARMMARWENGAITLLVPKPAVDP